MLTKAGNICENNRSRLFQSINTVFILDSSTITYADFRELVRHHIHAGQMAGAFMECFLTNNWPKGE
jgi:hypothetical protein